ncbi:MAG: hypothetical protein ACWGSQ_05010 [Longimicrobiales bacterium]
MDEEQVNLTGFSLFYLDERKFFLENSGIFDVGVDGGFGTPPYKLFVSRRIGIGEEGSIPILGGAKPTGRIGGQTVGFMNVITGQSGDIPRTSYSVTHLKLDVGENNFLGAVVADRREGDGSNTVLGLEGSIWFRPTLNMHGFFNRSFTASRGEEGNASSASLDYNTDFLGFSPEHLTVDPEMRADLGFITRTDVRQTSLDLHLSPWPGRCGVRVVDIRPEVPYISTTSGRMQGWMAEIYAGPDSEFGESIGVNVALGETELVELHPPPRKRTLRGLDAAAQRRGRSPGPLGPGDRGEADVFGEVSRKGEVEVQPGRRPESPRGAAAGQSGRGSSSKSRAMSDLISANSLAAHSPSSVWE